MTLDSYIKFRVKSTWKKNYCGDQYVQIWMQDSFTALKLAAQYGLIDILKYLIEAGADVNKNKMVCTNVL